MKTTVIQLLREGHTYKYIALLVGVSKQRIYQIAKEFNLTKKEKKQNALADKWEYQFTRWGQFFVNGKIHDKEFALICKEKFSQKKANATRVGILWEIKFHEIEWNTVCPILGITLDYFADNRQENSPSFDKINPDLGYISGNVCVMSWRANRIKNNGTAEEHRKIATFLDNTQKPCN